MSDCLQMAEGAVYQKLSSLQDIKNLRDLSTDNVRDILRSSLRDSSVEIVSVGELKDMSGTNDAFNSSICSLQVKAKLLKSKEPAAAATTTDPSNNVPSNNDKDESSDGGTTAVAADSTAVVGGEDNDKTAAAAGTWEERTFDLVVKSPPKASFMRLMHRMTKPFLNEVTWYLDMINQIQYVEKMMPQDEEGKDFKLANIVPTCYHAFSNYYAGEVTAMCQGGPWFCSLLLRSAEEGILILENVKRRGYQMHDKMTVLPLDHFQLAMTDLAHFHGRWLVFRWLAEAGKLGEGAWSPDYMKQCLNTQKRTPRFIYKKLLAATRKTVTKILELEGKTAEYRDRIRKFFNVTAAAQLDQFMNGVDTPIDTCCHGDFWSNNIMFKYSADGAVEKTMLIDFQLINFGHPAYDVLYLLYLSSDIEFRDSHMESCLQHYWSTFSTYLEKYGPEDLKYGYTEFKADVQIYKSIVFVLATTLLPNVLSDIQVEAGGLLALHNLQRKQAQELQDPNKPSSKEIKRRVIGLVEEMARENII
eukprot:TRINITY_DN6120_c0_g1_i4.p1 TRINITY_DN6120_c0_g1~~TRINITY_DN6120_c0_g1_i4.p1  ORF type:complete len:530 (-),score=152.55 TRINITY_DN6120_c0_g1_i4:450-2039(-)